MADGHLNKCIDCARDDVRKNREKRLDQYRAYDRKRAKTSKRRRLSARVMRRYRSSFPERATAMSRVHYAIRSGRLKREPCEVCGRADSHAHHDDYSKPLEVRWLCPVHHKAVHNRRSN